MLRPALVLRTIFVRFSHSHLPNYRGLEQNTMYSLFDDLFSTPRFYSARPRVYVISDSEYKAAQDRKNAERVAHLENVRADLLDSVNKVEEQIAELQLSLPEAKEAAKAPAPAVEPAGVKAPVAV